MINPFSQFNFKASNIVKVVGLSFLVVIVLAFAFRLVGSSVKSLMQNSQTTRGSATYNNESYGLDVVQEGYSDSGFSLGKVSSPSLSVRNIAPEPPYSGGSTGNTAEAFEMRDYNATIETRNVKKTCGSLLSLKALSYVIFENANEYDRGCQYVFKTEKNHTEEILAAIKEHDPKDLTVNTRTIKQTLDDYTSQIDILKKKQKTIEETLESAIGSYDEISRLATQTRDAQSLANIIESKIRIIERLTQERLAVSDQLDRLTRSKAEQLDRIEYTYFSVTVAENRFVDGESLKDSWKVAVKEFVRDVNRIAQEITVKLATVILVVLQYVLYLFILLIAAKVVWRGARRLWTGKQSNTQ